VQVLKKKGFARNDKNLHSDGDFFAIRLVAQQLIAVTWYRGNQTGARLHAGFIFFRPAGDDGERAARDVSRHRRLAQAAMRWRCCHAG
jgi:hypothetical protein